MRHTSSEPNDGEHPWIRQARKAKAGGASPNEGDEKSVDEVILPEIRKPPYAIATSAILILLLMAGIAFRLAIAPRPSDTPPLPQLLQLWHRGSEAEMATLQQMAEHFTETTGIRVQISWDESRTGNALQAFYAVDGPDIVVIDSVLADQVAQGNGLLTLDGRSPLYRRLAPDEYFLPLTSGSAFTRPVGIVIPRRTRNIDLARQFIDHIRGSSPLLPSA